MIRFELNKYNNVVEAFCLYDKTKNKQIQFLFS